MNLEIKPNKRRIPVGFIIGLIGCLILYFVILKKEEGLPWYYYIPVYIILFIYCFIFATISLIDYFKTLFDKHAVLIISDSDVYDNLSIFSVGKILRNDILDIEIKKEFNFDFLIIKLSDTNKYLANKNFIKRYILNRYIKRWKSPVVISNNRIDYDLQQLKKIILTPKTN